MPQHCFSGGQIQPSQGPRCVGTSCSGPTLPADCRGNVEALEWVEELSGIRGGWEELPSPLPLSRPTGEGNHDGRGRIFASILVNPTVISVSNRLEKTKFS